MHALFDRPALEPKSTVTAGTTYQTASPRALRICDSRLSEPRTLLCMACLPVMQLRENKIHTLKTQLLSPYTLRVTERASHSIIEIHFFQGLGCKVELSFH